jgi:nucleotide-binding universal stress UspA family protein
MVVCVAHDVSGPGLVTLASSLRGAGEASRVYALGLVRMTERGSFYIDGVEEKLGASTLAPALERAAELALPLKPLSFVSADPARDICDVAEVKHADLVLLGWHKPVLTRARLGGVVADVMREARSDVGVLVDRGLGQTRRVLVPFVGTEHDRAALALARRMLASEGTEVTVLHVIKPRRRSGDEMLGAKDAVDSVFEEGRGKVVFQVVEHESPADAVLAESERGYDLVIVGMGRDWGLEQRQFGVQPERLMRECATSLLVVRRGTLEHVAAPLGAA